MVAAKRKKPAKPYSDFPLFPHDGGVWAKKIRGKLHYFGPWSDPDGSLEKYRLQVDDLQAGRVPRPPTPDGYTLESLANDFLNEKKIKMDEGRMTPRMMANYQEVCSMLIDHFGRQRLVDDIRPEDFRQLRAELGVGPKGKRGIVTISNIVRMTRSVFKFASDNELIDRPLNFGTGFKMPTKTELRKARQTREKRQFSAEEIRRQIDTVGIPLKAMILLGINAGFGPTDLAQLPIRAVDLKSGWLTFPRPKTGVDRRAKLWPETIKAINDAIKERLTPKDDKDAGLLFLTRLGQPWVRCRDQMIPDGDQQRLRITFADAIGPAFRKLLIKLGMDRDNKNFYGLRHTFLTVADEVRDKPATDLIMGHVHRGIDADYREHIDDSRLMAVSDYVHRWLFREPPKRNLTAKRKSRR